MLPAWLSPSSIPEGEPRVVELMAKAERKAEEAEREDLRKLRSEIATRLARKREAEKIRQARLKAAETKRIQYAGKRREEHKDWWRKFLD